MKLIATTAAAVLITTQAFAGSWETRCQTTSTPYQAQVKGGSTEQVVGGALIGGVIGKVVTNEDAGALAGAVIGGAVANENAKKTVTRYKDVETCRTVFIPDRITNEDVLREVLLDLNEGRSVSNEMTRDVQYTIGVAYDGKWGPKSQEAAEVYLANLEPEAPMYSLVVNEVVILSSADVIMIDQIRSALLDAGVNSQIIVNMAESM